MIDCICFQMSPFADCVYINVLLLQVADDGYGVSYIVAGEDIIFFHISRKRTCGVTVSSYFYTHVTHDVFV